MAKPSNPTYNERARQEAAYNLLKEAGKKVKPRFEDYVSGRGRNRSLINRAGKLLKEVERNTFERRDGKGKTVYFTYNRTVNLDSYPPALDIARDMIITFSGKANRAQVSLYGTYTVSDKEQTDWIIGQLSQIKYAVDALEQAIIDSGFAFSKIKLVQVRFAENR
jgi:hypothetical protein